MTKTLSTAAVALLFSVNSAGTTAEILTPEQLLGQMLYMDTNLSLQRNQSCNSCHDVQPVAPKGESKPLPAAGFVDPDNVREGSAVSKGSIEGASGALNAPSASYARFSPHFHWDGEEGLYIGGQISAASSGTVAPPALPSRPWAPRSTRWRWPCQAGGRWSAG